MPESFAASVVAASNAWVWIPDIATTAETDEYLLIRFPDYFEHPLELVRFTPAVPPADTGDPGAVSNAVSKAVDRVLDRAREYGLAELWWMVRLDSPPGVPDELSARGATVSVTLDVLALDLSNGVPEMPAPAREVEVRWATDVTTERDGTAVGVEVFGGSMPPPERLEENAKRTAATVETGEGGPLVAYVGGTPVGIGGVTMADGVARFWGGAVVESARHQGVYRVLLAARLAYAAAHGATMALVKGRINTSAPIFRQIGFTAHGQEILYHVPLT